MEENNVQPVAVQQPNNNVNYNVQSPNMTEEISAGYFFGMTLLYSIPVAGWIACLIVIFTEKNKSKRNFAISKLIWIIIGLFMFMGIISLLSLVGEILETVIEGFGNIMSQNFDVLQGVEGLTNMEGLPNPEDLAAMEEILNNITPSDFH